MTLEDIIEEKKMLERLGEIEVELDELQRERAVLMQQLRERED